MIDDPKSASKIGSIVNTPHTFTPSINPPGFTAVPVAFVVKPPFNASFSPSSSNPNDAVGGIWNTAPCKPAANTRLPMNFNKLYVLPNQHKYW